jgi:hypothetical protein
MTSGRSSPLRPFKQPPKMESNTSQPQSRIRQQRQASANPGTAGQLRLPGLPRFHPANFPSAASSMATTPSSGINSPQPPMSPRSQQKQYSEAQRQLLNYQRDIFAHKRTTSGNAKPTSPRLMPLAGSPGPVTPLELEADGYLTAGSSATNNAAQSEYVDQLIREEAARRGNISPSSSTPVSSY